jgi:TadE-like protein
MDHLSRKYRRKARLPSRGAITVEVAITLPVLLLIVAMAIDLINVYTVISRAEMAVLRAGRTGSLPGATRTEVLDAFSEEVRRLGMDSSRMKIDLNDVALASEISFDVTIPLSETSWIAPLFMRDATYTVGYSRPTEDFPRNFLTAEDVAAPRRRGKFGFNKKH